MRPWLRDPRLWTLLLGTVITLGMAWVLKGPCAAQPWEDELQYRELCYNDIQPLYYARSMDQKVFPYVGAEGTNPDSDMTPKGFVEYPVLTGLLMWVAALLSTNGDEFMVWNSVLLSLFALGTTIVLFLAVGDRRRVAYWAAAPPLILYAFHNWDLIAVFFATLGLFFYRNGKWASSGAAIALGASAKLYPIFFLPMLGLAILRRERRLGADSWRFGLGALGGLLAVNGPFMLINFDLWLFTYQFHARRVPNFETPWHVIQHYGERWQQDWMTQAVGKATLDTMIVLLLVAVLTLLGWLVWSRRVGPVEAALGAMVSFMMLNKIYSVQYTLWVMPFFALLGLPRRKYAALIAGDAVTYIAVFTFFLHWGTTEEYRQYYGYVALGVLARFAALAWILAGIVWTGFRPAAENAEEPVEPSPGLEAELPSPAEG